MGNVRRIALLIMIIVKKILIALMHTEFWCCRGKTYLGWPIEWIVVLCALLAQLSATKATLKKQNADYFWGQNELKDEKDVLYHYKIFYEWCLAWIMVEEIGI